MAKIKTVQKIKENNTNKADPNDIDIKKAFKVEVLEDLGNTLKVKITEKIKFNTADELADRLREKGVLID